MLISNRIKLTEEIRGVDISLTTEEGLSFAGVLSTLPHKEGSITTSIFRELVNMLGGVKVCQESELYNDERKRVLDVVQIIRS